MKRVTLYIFLITFLTAPIFAEGNEIEIERDSLRNISLTEISVFSAKETNLLNAPVSSSVIDNEKIEQSQIFSIKDVSAKVPNFYLPDYGSAMSNSPYVRGVGSRYSGQSIALYIDNVPYMEKTAFDFELYDLAQIEVLRGPQGTLYGRNSIGGLVNIITLSPLDYQGSKIAVSAGNYGQLHAKASHYAKFNDKIGVSLSGYYGQHDGFYKNAYTGKMVDAETSAGARLKLAWKATNRLKLEYISDFDYIDQGAFPYGLYDNATGKVAQTAYNDLSNYYRKTLNNSISGRYLWDGAMLNFTVSHQYFDDQMDIDQDFTPQSIFTLQQITKQNLLNSEVVLKSASTSNYKWLFGLNGFAQKYDLEAPVYFKRDGIDLIFGPIFSAQGITVLNDTYDIPGTYDTQRSGGAFFHQSTFDNLHFDGLSLTVGARVDVDNVRLDYNTSAAMDLEMKRGPQVIRMPLKTELTGVADTLFVQFLPKMALKYEWGKSNFLYGSIARGYKTGGFNIQMISDLVSEKLRNPNNEPDVKQRTLYKPEESWNYEIGFAHTFFDRKLKGNITLFYMDINGLQLTEFIESGTGRKLTNAGKSVSKGVELSAWADLSRGFNLDINYGFAHATFKRYSNIEKVNGKDETIDYYGKFVPYAPRHTLNANLNYQRTLQNSFLTQLYGTLSWSGLGRIYWHENNELYQGFYQLIDTRLGVKKDIFSLELWGKNLSNSDYNAFYFESFNNKFFQKGKPLQAGVRLAVEF